jgi:bifunctional DNA-binding transcriptional regulator/antitoxin component of YhaV-PrlF toxin-antitoxin module
MTNINETKEIDEQERSQKIDSLRDMISSAEKTIQGAKAMLLQLEGKKRVGRRHKTQEFEDGSTIVQGTFDGQIMIGTDGKQYPVPANYASKSKLVEGDMLKLTITSDGSFIYKQIGPAERRHALGIATQDENGNYYIIANGKPHRILLASITYFHVEPGDEVAIVLPRDIDSSWAAVENIVAKAKEHPEILAQDTIIEMLQKAQQEKENHESEEIKETVEKNPVLSEDDTSSLELLDEWKADIEQIERELEEKKKNETV